MQSGRSMVEMLGVLSIIGLLSIGVLYLYRYAMDKYQANETMQQLSIRAADLLIQIERLKSGSKVRPSLAEWRQDLTIFPITLDTTVGYGLKVSGIRPRICEMINDGLKQVAVIYIGDEKINDNEAPCAGQEENTIEVYFNSINKCEKDADCMTDKKCVEDICVVK